jgi:hypothetical protein
LNSLPTIIVQLIHGTFAVESMPPEIEYHAPVEQELSASHTDAFLPELN